MMDKIIKLRAEITEIDRKIVVLIHNRAMIALQLGVLKTELGIPIEDKEREQRVLEDVSKLVSETGIDPDFISELFLKIIDYCKKIQ
jgi:chorismate mutase